MMTFQSLRGPAESFATHRSTLKMLLLSVAWLVTASCTSSPRSSNDPLIGTGSEGPAGLKVPTNHQAVIESGSAGNLDYAGLYNTFDFRATLLNSRVRDALIQRQGESYQWDASKLATERERSTQEASAETVIFLSFFTPERRNDNLADTKSIWRALLDVGGRRYEAKVKKDRRLVVELQSLFPYHTRWNSPYILTFPVSTMAIESQVAQLTITGPLGTQTVNFQPLP
jgi:hypothetical protein